MSDSRKPGLLAAAIVSACVIGASWSGPTAAAGGAPFAAPWMDATHGAEVHEDFIIYPLP